MISNNLYKKLHKLNRLIISNLPIFLTLLILLFSFGYTLERLNLESIQLTDQNTSSLNDFSYELKSGIKERIGLIETIMMNQWIDTNNISQLYNYQRYLEIVPAFYNYSKSFLAINWINNSGIINWVYPYNRNANAINKSVIYYQTGDKSINDGFYIAKNQNKTGLGCFSSSLYQGGEGLSAYIPIFYHSILTGYFNVVFEINDSINTIISHERSLLSFSFKISENSSLISNVNGNISLSDFYLASKNITVYNRLWTIYSQPHQDLIYKTTLSSVSNVILIELSLGILTYILTNQLKKKNGIIEKDFLERERVIGKLYEYEKFEALGRLAGGIAHDFNNIMTNIIGHFELIKTEINQWDETVNYSLISIEKNLKRSKEITGQILSFAKKGNSDSSIVNVRNVVQETLSMVKEMADKRIAFSLQTEKNYYLRGNQTQIIQIFMNILINSINAFEDYNNPKITITFEEVKPESITSEIKKILINQPEFQYLNSVLLIKIRDNGRGMTAEQIKHAFDPYYNISKNKKGTGLGLGIVYNNVRNLGGFVEIDSQKSHYTETKMIFPLIQTETIAETTLLEDFKEKSFQHNTKKILLIDDEKDIVFSYTKLLHSHGIDATGFTNGKEAWKFFEENNNFDLIITDINLTDMSGFDLIKKIKKFKPEQEILIASGYFEKQEALSDIKVLQKPFKIDELIEMIEKI